MPGLAGAPARPGGAARPPPRWRRRLLVDLSPSYFRVYFDILMRLQDADADGEIEPHEAEEMWTNLRNGEYDEDDPELHDETTVLSASMQVAQFSMSLPSLLCDSLFFSDAS